MGTRHWFVIIVGAVSGVCFAAVAARSLSALAVTSSRFQAYCVIYAAVGVVLAYFCFRAATSGRTDEDGFMHSLWGGFAGAVVGLVIIFAVYVMFRDPVRVYFARPLGLHLSQVTMFRLVTTFFALGFGAGFALKTQTRRER